MTGAVTAGAICIGIGAYTSDWAPAVIGAVLIALAGLVYAAGYGR